MGKAKNLLFHRFSKLLVVGRAENGKDGHARWFCRCDCGGRSVVVGKNLWRGHTKSCGCLKRVSGEESNEWKGDDVGEKAAHRWLSKNKQKPNVCERCRERPVKELSYNLKKGEWSRNPNDYEWLCGSCHQMKDKGSGAILTKARVHRIREFHRAGAAQVELAEMFSIGQSTISRVICFEGVYAQVA